MAYYEKATKYWVLPFQKVLDLFQSNEKGLTDSEAQDRLKKYGSNEILEKEKRQGMDIFFSQFKNPLILVLIIAAIIAYFLHDKLGAIVILAIVFINTFLGFFQEYRSEKALRELKKYVTFKARVLRDGEISEIASQNIVLGDVVYLTIGDMIPADIRLSHVENMTTDESSLTGESIPVLKDVEPISEQYSLPQDITNVAFRGTSVASGSGRGIVIATGKDTFFDKIAVYLKEKPHEGDFQKNIREFSNFLLKIIIVMTLFIFAANAILGKDIFISFLFALALAVGITPEALPIVITITLSRGALKMAKEKVIIKKLATVEDFGNMDILCTDKTGTLTEGKLSLYDYVTIDGQKDDNLILYGLLCNSAEEGKDKKVFGDPIDKAIWKSQKVIQLKPALSKYKIIRVNGFDFERKRMSVAVEIEKRMIAIVKGAFESILEVCNSAVVNGHMIEFSSELISTIQEKITGYENEGYRIIAIATKSLNKLDLSKDNLEKELVLLGFLLFLDPPKKTVKESLKILQNLKVNIKVLSGDSPIITRKICNEVGLSIVNNKVITGEELTRLNEDKLGEYCYKHNVFARVTPEQKYKIVASLKGQGHIVGFMGDGINDAPALKVADVGISVDTAIGIAKEAADIILLQKSLRVLAHGIIEGRKTFTNIIKYILNTISANFGNMFTVALSSLFLKFIPLLPSQILLNNFMSDIPLLTISTDNVDKEFLKRPRRWNIKVISMFMMYFGLISTFFDLVLIFALIFFIKTEPELFRTAWFLESALSEIMVTFSIRTRLLFLKSMPSKWLLITSLLTSLTVVTLINTTFGNRFFAFVKLPPAVVILISVILTAYFITIEITKKYFFKRFDI